MIPAPCQAYQLYVGVDIAALSFSTVLLPVNQSPKEAEDFKQTEPDYARFAAKLAATHPTPAQVLIVVASDFSPSKFKVRQK